MLYIRSPFQCLLGLFLLCAFAACTNGDDTDIDDHDHPDPISQDSSRVHLELRWGEDDTDLDFYFSNLSRRDTVNWRQKNIAGDTLDIDVTDGFGPERIYPANTDTLAAVGVHYYGPPDGDSTETTLHIFQGTTQLARVGPCWLKPQDFWDAAQYEPRQMHFLFPDSSCSHIKRDSTLSHLGK